MATTPKKAASKKSAKPTPQAEPRSLADVAKAPRPGSTYKPDPLLSEPRGPVDQEIPPHIQKIVEEILNSSKKKKKCKKCRILEVLQGSSPTKMRQILFDVNRMITRQLEDELTQAERNVDMIRKETYN